MYIFEVFWELTVVPPGKNLLASCGAGVTRSVQRWCSTGVANMQRRPELTSYGTVDVSGSIMSTLNMCSEIVERVEAEGRAAS